MGRLAQTAWRENVAILAGHPVRVKRCRLAGWFPEAHNVCVCEAHLYACMRGIIEAHPYASLRDLLQERTYTHAGTASGSTPYSERAGHPSETWETEAHPDGASLMERTTATHQWRPCWSSCQGNPPEADGSTTSDTVRQTTGSTL